MQQPRFFPYFALVILAPPLPVVQNGYVPGLRHFGHVRDILRGGGGGGGGLPVIRDDDHSVKSPAAVVVVARPGRVVLAIGD